MGQVKSFLKIFKIKGGLLFASLVGISIAAGLFWKPLYVSSVLCIIPEKERGDLEYFFHFLNIEGFPWVAKGIKPIATYYVLSNIRFIINNPNIDLFSKQDEIFWSMYPTNVRFRMGHNIWKKYSHFFPSNKISVVSGNPSILPAYETIMMINIKKAEHKIRNHYQNFKSVLGGSFTAAALVEKLAKNPGDFEKILKGNHHLIGILYGFGSENAMAFHLREEPYSFSIPPFSKQYLTSFNDKEEIKLGFFLEKKAPYDPFNPWFWTPGFIVKPDSSETKALEREYLELFKKISLEKRGTSELKWSLLQFF